MNFFDILNQIAEYDPEVVDRLDGRRAAMRQFASFGKKAALASLPLALGSMFNKAYGRTNDTVVEILNYALTLEHLEANFYSQVVAANLATGAAQGALTKIRDDENKHVSFLTTTITAVGGTPVGPGNYDFTAGGAFPDALTNYDTALALAQAFEDTGVRAYKGRAGELIGNANGALQAALQIHSVEARHASHIRAMRQASVSTLKRWPTGGDGASNGLPASTNAVYGAGSPATTFAAESNTTQGGAETKGLGNVNGVTEGSTAAQESFDEALDKATVLSIAGLFIRP